MAGVPLGNPAHLLLIPNVLMKAERNYVYISVDMMNLKAETNVLLGTARRLRVLSSA